MKQAWRSLFLSFFFMEREHTRDEEIGLKIEERCIFCQIARGFREKDRILYEVDEESL